MRIPQHERYYVDAHPKQRMRVRRLVYERAAGLCAICGEALRFDEMHVDHIMPRARGGEDAEHNLQATHRYCNQSKGTSGDAPLVEWPKPKDRMTVIDMALRVGESSAALRLAIHRGSLKAEKVGSGRHAVWLVSLPEVERYERENKGKRGTSSPRHPGTGGRPRKEQHE